MNAAVAIAPLLVVFLLLVFWRWPAKRTMPVAFALTAVLAYFYWKVSAGRIASRISGSSGCWASTVFQAMYSAVSSGSSTFRRL